MLIVVEDGDVELRLQTVLDLEAPGRGDVFEVYAAEGWGYALHGLYDFLGILGIQADGKRVDLGELLKEHRLALHDRHRRPGSYVPQAQHRRPVRDDGHGVALDSEVERPFGVLGYGPAYPSDPRRVRHREVIAGAERHLGVHLYLPPEVHKERAVRDVHYPNLRERLYCLHYGAPMI